MASSVLFAAALPSVLAGALVIAIVGFKCHPLLLAGLRSLVSRTVNAILLYRYPIKHTEQSSRLPSLPYVFPDGQGNVEKFMHGRANSAKWEAEYGSLYRVWSGTKSEVVLTKSEHVEIVFRDSHAHRKADAINSGYLMHSLLGSCLGLINGETWGTVKKCVEAPFLHAAMSASAVDVQVFTRAYMRSLAKDVDEFRRFGKLHPVRDLKLLPFLLVAKVIYGLLPSSLEQELIDLIPPRETLFKSVISGGITRFGLSRFLPLPEIRALHEFKDRFADWSSRAHAHVLD